MFAPFPSAPIFGICKKNSGSSQLVSAAGREAPAPTSSEPMKAISMLCLIVTGSDGLERQAPTKWTLTSSPSW